MNKYHSFYCAELNQIIMEVVLESMIRPEYKPETDLADLKTLYHNDGIKTLAVNLIKRIEKEATEDGTA